MGKLSRIKNVSIKQMMLILSKFNLEYERVDVVIGNNTIAIYPVIEKDIPTEDDPPKINPDSGIDEII